MRVTKIISFLVYPGKHDTNSKDSRGTELALKGILYNKLCDVFERSDEECNVPIRFLMSEAGTQDNPFRSRIISYLKSPTLETGLVIANSLRDVTTKKPNLGLFFLINGFDGKLHKIVLSRFPVDQGILAEESRNALRIEYLERIFMKNAASYKAALYIGESFDTGFWEGHVIDRQLNEPADYWIRDFLCSDYKTTSKFGTRRLATALKEASQKITDLNIKQEIVAAIILAKAQFGKSISITQFITQLGLSEVTQREIISLLPNDALANDFFILDKEEFINSAPLASIELDSGGILVAPSDRFNDCFTREVLDKFTNLTRFTTTGHVVDERLKGKR